MSQARPSHSPIFPAALVVQLIRDPCQSGFCPCLIVCLSHPSHRGVKRSVSEQGCSRHTVDIAIACVSVSARVCKETIGGDHARVSLNRDVLSGRQRAPGPLVLPRLPSVLLTDLNRRRRDSAIATLHGGDRND